MKKTRLLGGWAVVPVVVGMLACGGDEGGTSAPPLSNGGSAGAAAGGSAGKAGGAGTATAGAAGKAGSAGQSTGGSAGQTTGGSAGQTTGGSAGQTTGGTAGQTTGGAAGAAGQTTAGAAGAAGQTSGGSAGQATGGAAGQATGGAAGQATGGAAGQATGGSAGQTSGGAAGADAGGAAGAGGGGSNVKEACIALATAQCEKRKDCLADQPTRIWAKGGTQDCIDGLAKQCIDVTKDESTKLKPADRLACAEATKAATCTEWRATGPLKGCGPVPGADDDGVGCTFDSECKSTYCQRERDASCGKCAPLPAVNADCTLYDCGPQALACQASASPVGPAKTCQKPAAEGESCTKDNDCDGGLRCGPGAIGLKKECVALRQGGEICDADGDCDQGLTCKPGSGPLAKGSCAALPVGGPGDACGAKAKGALCGKGSSCVEGTCVTYAVVDEVCDLAKGPECLPFATCIETKALKKHACVLLSEVSCKQLAGARLA